MLGQESARTACASEPPSSGREQQSPILVLSASWKLSSREREVLKHCGEGQRNKQIAASMCCSTKTVETYWRRIFIKSGYSAKEEILAALLRMAIAQRGEAHEWPPATKAPPGLGSGW